MTPRDSNGVWHEPTNDDRAGWALVALNAFAAQVRMRPEEQTVDTGNVEDLEEVLGDLLADLMHLAERHAASFAVCLGRAYRHYEDEAEEEELTAGQEVVDLLHPNVANTLSLMLAQEARASRELDRDQTHVVDGDQ